MTENESGTPEAVDFSALRQQIQQHPGMLARRSWDALVDVHVVLTSNQQELAKLVNAIEQNADNLAVTTVSNVGPEEPRRAVFRELLRRLHNYVASAGTLIDHTRKLTRKYEGTPTHDEYLRRLALATDEKVLPLVSKLRNYVLHVGVPAIGIQVSFSEGQENFLVFIDRDRALVWKDWPKAAREFLEEQPEKVSLTAVIEQYGRVIEELYGWLHDQFYELHAADLADVNGLIEKLRRSAFGRDQE